MNSELSLLLSMMFLGFFFASQGAFNKIGCAVLSAFWLTAKFIPFDEIRIKVGQ